MTAGGKIVRHIYLCDVIFGPKSLSPSPCLFTSRDCDVTSGSYTAMLTTNVVSMNTVRRKSATNWPLSAVLIGHYWQHCNTRKYKQQSATKKYSESTKNTCLLHQTVVLFLYRTTENFIPSHCSLASSFKVKLSAKLMRFIKYQNKCIKSNGEQKRPSERPREKQCPTHTRMWQETAFSLRIS